MSVLEPRAVFGFRCATALWADGMEGVDVVDPLGAPVLWTLKGMDFSILDRFVLANARVCETEAPATTEARRALRERLLDLDTWRDRCASLAMEMLALKGAPMRWPRISDVPIEHESSLRNGNWAKHGELPRDGIAARTCSTTIAKIAARLPMAAEWECALHGSVPYSVQWYGPAAAIAPKGPPAGTSCAMHGADIRGEEPDWARPADGRQLNHTIGCISRRARHSSGNGRSVPPIVAPFGMSPPPTISATRLTELLALVLGWDRSVEVVSLARGGQTSAELSLDEALALLDTLSESPGMVGIAARYAATRVQEMRPAIKASGVSGDRSSRPGEPPSTRPSRPSAPPSSSGALPSGGPSSWRSRPITLRPEAPSSGPTSTRPLTIELREVIDLFAGTMGNEKSEDVVLSAARRLGFAGERLDRTRALALVDSLADEAGMVGLCARFAKARLILRFAA